MNAPRPVAPKRCPSCGAPLAPLSMTCQTCGAVVALEAIVAQGRRAAFDVFFDSASSLSRSDAPIWALALFPMLLAPPILALLLARRAQKRGAPFPNATWIIVVAALNILLSLLLWRSIALMGWGFLAHLSDWLRPIEPPRRNIVPI